jgi:hypothetical protein
MSFCHELLKFKATACSSYCAATLTHLAHCARELLDHPLARSGSGLGERFPQCGQKSICRRFSVIVMSNVELMSNAELTGRQRWDAKPGLAKMYRVQPDRAWWPAVGAPVERPVRQLFTSADQGMRRRIASGTPIAASTFRAAQTCSAPSGLSIAELRRCAP